MRLDRAGLGNYAPAGAFRGERARVAFQNGAAALDEEIEIGRRQRAGVGRRQGIGKMHAADGGFADMRLQLQQSATVERRVADPEGARLLGFPQARVTPARASGTP